MLGIGGPNGPIPRMYYNIACSRITWTVYSPKICGR